MNCAVLSISSAALVNVRFKLDNSLINYFNLSCDSLLRSKLNSFLIADNYFAYSSLISAILAISLALNNVASFF